MSLHKVTEVTLPVQGVSMDYLEPFLAIAIECGIIYVYQKNTSFESICMEENLPMIDLVKWFQQSHLLITTFDGIIIILNFSVTSRRLFKSFQLSIHCSSIKSLIVQSDLLISCSLDNRVCILTASCRENKLDLSLKSAFEAHKGWVNGMTISETYLITQGENLVVSFWDLKTFTKAKEVQFIQNCQLSCLTRPVCIRSWVLLANTCSQIDGQPCLTLVNEKTLQIVEISFDDFQLLRKIQERKNQGKARIQVQGYLDMPFGTVVFAVSLILVLDLSTFKIKHRLFTKNDIIVSLTSGFLQVGRQLSGVDFSRAFKTFYIIIH